MEKEKYREIEGYCMTLPANVFKSIFRESRNGRGRKWTWEAGGERKIQAEALKAEEGLFRFKACVTSRDY